MLISEASPHTGHPAIKVGVLVKASPRLGQDRWKGICERCSRALQPTSDPKEAQRALRAHRQACRPPLKIEIGHQKPRPPGIPETTSEPSVHTGHSRILTGWLYRLDAEPATPAKPLWTPVCERCSEHLPRQNDRNAAGAALRKHRTTCTPATMHGRRQ